MIAADKLVELLAAKKAVPAALLENLRKQVAHAPQPVAAAVLAKRLVEKGHLSADKARQFLAELERSAGQHAKPSAPASATPIEDELLAPLEEEDPFGMPKEPKSAPAAAPQAKKEGGAKATPSGPKAGPAKGGAPGAKEAATDKAAGDLNSLLDQELGGLGAMGGGDSASLDNLFAAAAMEAPAAAAGAAPTPGATGKPAALKTAKPLKPKAAPAGPSSLELLFQNRLLWISVGVAAGLLIVVGLLVVIFTRPSGNELLVAADGDYQAGRFAPASQKYREFLEEFPNHPRIADARARSALSELRAGLGEEPKWPQVLAAAKQVLSEAQTAPSRDAIRQDLAPVLLATAEGLSAAMAARSDSSAIAQAREAQELVRLHVPGAKRNWNRMARMELSLALAEQKGGKTEQVRRTVAAIGAAASARKFGDAYAARRDLMRRYPESADDPALAEAMRAAADAEKSAIQPGPFAAAIEKTEPASPILSCAAFVQPIVQGTGSERSPLVVVEAEATAYALETATGKLRWQRYVGPEAGLAAPRGVVSADATVFLADRTRKELLRVDATTGKLQWRLPLGDAPAGPPDTAGKQVAVITTAGRLLLVDPSTGKAITTPLPQSCPTGAVLDWERRTAYVVGDEEMLYAVGTDDGRCRQVVHLGHGAGTVAAPPARAGRFLLLAVRIGLQQSQIKVIDTGTAAGAILKIVQQVPIEGVVDTTPAADAGYVSIGTDRGNLQVFRIDAAAAQPLTPAGTVAGEGGTRLPRYSLLAGDQLWLADSAMRKFALTKDGSLTPVKLNSEPPALYAQPLLVTDKAVIGLRTQDGLPGMLAAAWDRGSGNKQWEVRLATPLSATLMAGSNSLIAVTAAGAVFRLDPSRVASSPVVAQPVATIDPARLTAAAAAVWRFDEGRLALAGESLGDVAVVDLDGKKPVEYLPVPEVPNRHPVAWGGGFLIPSGSGQVALLDVRSGKPLVEPFQPPLKAGARPKWRDPGLAADQLVLTDGTKLYLLGVRREPKPHLASLAEADLSTPLVSPLAIAGKVAYGMDAQANLVSFELPKLTRGQSWRPGGQAAWGPHALQDLVLMATTAGKLLAVDSQQKLAWQVDVSAAPVGMPAKVPGGWMLALADGTILKIDPAKGSIAGKIALGHGLATGPLVAGGRLFVAGNEGTLLEVKPL